MLLNYPKVYGMNTNSIESYLIRGTETSIRVMLVTYVNEKQRKVDFMQSIPSHYFSWRYSKHNQNTIVPHNSPILDRFRQLDKPRWGFHIFR